MSWRRRGDLFLDIRPSWPILFFFQAEDGIRDRNETGVQTCALPIFPTPERAVSGVSRLASEAPNLQIPAPYMGMAPQYHAMPTAAAPPPRRCPCVRPATDWPTLRSEERRVGKECRSRRAEAQ